MINTVKNGILQGGGCLVTRYWGYGPDSL